MRLRRVLSRPSPWIAGPGRDTVLAWGWLPLFIVALVIERHGDRQNVVQLLAGAFTLSVLHQPLSLLLAYGDERTRARHPLVFLLAPLVVVPLLAAAIYSRLWLLLPVATVWQLVHTQQQRFGVMRLYARGDARASRGMDRAVAWLPFLGALALVATSENTRSQLLLFGNQLGASRRQAVAAVLARADIIRPLVAPLVTAAIVILLVYVWQARRQTLPRLAYVASGVALCVGLVVSPIAGLIAYLVSHALEYLVLVHQRIASGSSSRCPALKASGVVVAFLALYTLGGAHAGLRGKASMTATMSVGMLHFVYDGLIWRSRRKSRGDATPLTAARS